MSTPPGELRCAGPGAGTSWTVRPSFLPASPAKPAFLPPSQRMGNQLPKSVQEGHGGAATLDSKLVLTLKHCPAPSEHCSWAGLTWWVGGGGAGAGPGGCTSHRCLQMFSPGFDMHALYEWGSSRPLWPSGWSTQAAWLTPAAVQFTLMLQPLICLPEAGQQSPARQQPAHQLK